MAEKKLIWSECSHLTKREVAVYESIYSSSNNYCITCMRSINEQCVRQLNGEVDESEI